MRVPFTVNSQRLALCKEGLGLLGLWPLVRIDGVLWHQFEEVEEELVKGAASPEKLGVMGSQLEVNERAGVDSMPSFLYIRLSKTDLTI